MTKRPTPPLLAQQDHDKAGGTDALQCIHDHGLSRRATMTKRPAHMLLAQHDHDQAGGTDALQCVHDHGLSQGATMTKLKVKKAYPSWEDLVFVKQNAQADLSARKGIAASKLNIDGHIFLEIIATAYLRADAETGSTCADIIT